MAELTEVLDKLESDGELLKFKETKSQLLIWPFLRYDILFYLTYVQNGFSLPPPKKKATLVEVIKSILFSFYRNPFFAAFSAKKKILIFNSGITNVLDENGYYQNKFADYFYQQYPDETLLIEETAYGKHSFPRSNKSVFSSLFLRLVGLFLSLFLLEDKKSNREIKSQITALINHKLSDLPHSQKEIENIVSEKLSRFRKIRAEYFVYRALLNFLKPSSIIVEDACYGPRAHLVYAAKRKGIKVIEYQHGLINNKHIAYNYGDGLHVAFYKEYLPDYFLSFGRFWSESIKLPVQLITIGNAHLTEFLKAHAGLPKEKRLLILGSGINSKEMIPTIEMLHRHAASLGMSTTFRPHPSEWGYFKEVYAELLSFPIEFETGRNLYESIQRSMVICAEMSTTVFESLAVTKSVYLIPSEYSTSFSSGAEVFLPTIFEWIDKKEGEKQAEMDFFWARNWDDNYIKFMNSIS